MMKTRFGLHFVLTFLLTSMSVQWVLAAPQGAKSQIVPQAAFASTTAVVISVPGEVANLQDAINQVPDGGIIELANGTYSAPSGGFRITNTHKRFMVRAAAGASVVLSGGNTREILRFMNTDITQSGPVVFQSLTFANGRSNSAGIAGGVTLHHAEATFLDCVFRDNTATSNGVGGGVLVGLGSVAFFFESLWQNNSAMNYGGGLVVGDQSKVYIHASQFVGNRVNLPNHSPTAAGGAIHIGNSLLRVSNSRFENNQAGYVGGAIYSIGTWSNPVSTPQTDVIVSNSTFVNNTAFRDGSVSFSVPTEGGAFHAESQTTAKIYNTRFINNSAMAGGAMTIYQAIVEIDDGVFLGNRAIGQGNMGGYGGAISVSSNDTSADGSTNRRNASLTVQNSYFQGRYGAVTTVGYGGGGIFMGGDINRMYGSSGVSKMGTAADNRGTLVVSNVIFNDLDVVKGNDEGMGGGVLVDLVDATIQNSLVMNSDGLGTNAGSGGGVAFIDQSIANVTDSTLAHNSSGRFGGAVYVSGSTINLLGSNLIENSVGSNDYGSAIFTAPLDSISLKLNVSGVIEGNKISNNTGTAVFDDDRTNGPINSVIYHNNDFYAGSQNAIVYSDAIYPYSWKNVSELNNLIVQRANGTSTDKSQTPNRALSSKPSIGSILTAPFEILGGTASGDAEPNTISYVGYAWSGGSATLNGGNLQENAGVLSRTNAGTDTLSVDGFQNFSQCFDASMLAMSFTGEPSGSSVTLNWSIYSGTYLDNQMDQGVRVSATPVGFVEVPISDLVYHFYAIAEEGGSVASQIPARLLGDFQVSIPLVMK